jgi:(S)-mandelate dehydrogenase
MTAERGGSAAPGFAATAICVPFVRRTLSNDAVEEVAKVKGPRHWWQLYVFGGECTRGGIGTSFDEPTN